MAASHGLRAPSSIEKESVLFIKLLAVVHINCLANLIAESSNQANLYWRESLVSWRVTWPAAVSSYATHEGCDCEGPQSNQTKHLPSRRPAPSSLPHVAAFARTSPSSSSQPTPLSACTTAESACRPRPSPWLPLAYFSSPRI